MKILLNVVSDSNDENNFSHKLLLTNTQVSKLRKSFANNLSKTRLHKTGQSRELLARLLGPLLKTGLPLIGNVLKPLAKSVLIPLGLTAAASATVAAIRKKLFGSGNTTLISNEEMNDIMKIIKSLQESDLLIKCVSETIKSEAKKEQGGFLSMLLGILGASLLRNLLTVKGTIRAAEDTFRAGKDF